MTGLTNLRNYYHQYKTLKNKYIENKNQIGGEGEYTEQFKILSYLCIFLHCFLDNDSMNANKKLEEMEKDKKKDIKKIDVINKIEELNNIIEKHEKSTSNNAIKNLNKITNDNITDSDVYDLFGIVYEQYSKDIGNLDEPFLSEIKKIHKKIGFYMMSQ